MPRRLYGKRAASYFSQLSDRFEIADTDQNGELNVDELRSVVADQQRSRLRTAIELVFGELSDARQNQGLGNVSWPSQGLGDVSWVQFRSHAALLSKTVAEYRQRVYSAQWVL